jgi:hypothetical protein
MNFAFWRVKFLGLPASPMRGYWFTKFYYAQMWRGVRLGHPQCKNDLHFLCLQCRTGVSISDIINYAGVHNICIILYCSSIQFITLHKLLVKLKITSTLPTTVVLIWAALNVLKHIKIYTSRFENRMEKSAPAFSWVISHITHLETNVLDLLYLHHKGWP